MNSDDDQIVEVGDTNDVEVIDVDDTLVDEPDLEPIPLKQEKTRGNLALALTGIFAFTVLATFVTAFFAQGDADWARISSILEVLLPAEMALLGSALGFYFGARTD